MSDQVSRPATYTYDPDSNAAYIELAGPTPAGGVARTVPVDASVDFDADGNPLGVEILGLYPDSARNLPAQSGEFHVQNMTSWLPYSAELAAEMTGRDETELRNLYGDTVMVRMGFGGPLELRWGGPGPNPAEIEEAQRIVRDALNPTGTTVTASEPRLSEVVIRDILRDLDLTDTVARINATPVLRPSDESHYAMVYLSDHATVAAVTALIDAFEGRGWETSVNAPGTKIHVADRGAPDKRSTPSGEAMKGSGEHGC